MNKKELVIATAEALRENGIRKAVPVKSETFRVSIDGCDDEGAFTVDRPDRRLLYTKEDVQRILDTALDIMTDAIQHGERIKLRGFGTFEARHVAARRAKEPNTGIWHDIPECYMPRFRPGFQLLAAARVYGLQLDDDDPESYLPPPEYDEDGD